MPNQTLTGIVEDGSVPTDGTLPRVAFRQDITWPIGYGGIVTFTMRHADGTLFDLDGCFISLVCRLHAADILPALAYSAEIDPTPNGGTSPGTAHVTILDGDTEDLIAGAVYWYDARLTTADTPPIEYQIVAPSKLTPLLAIARAGEPTV
jgi:hypothetical protein